MMGTLNLRTLPISELVAAPYNPRRKISNQSAAYKKLRKSIEEFGLVEPLIWNETTGHLVGGHLRLQILKELQYSEVPVSVVCLSPTREKALNIILNNQEAQGRYDPAKLAGLLEELQDLPELELTGFDQRTLKCLKLDLQELPSLESHSTTTELTLIIANEQLDNVIEKLNPIVREYDLRTHLKVT